MTDSEKQFEISKQFNEQQSKFVYYVTALCVSSIGFAVYSSAGQKLNCLHVLLGVAILSWGLSIYFSFKHINNSLSLMFENCNYFHIILGNRPELSKEKHNPNLVREVANEFLSEVEKSYSKKAVKYYRRMQIFFYVGVFIFIVWQGFNMAYFNK